MKRYTSILMVLAFLLAGAVLSFFACSPPKTEPAKTGTTADGEIDPAKWGQVYPVEYDRWKMTKESQAGGQKQV